MLKIQLNYIEILPVIKLPKLFQTAVFEQLNVKSYGVFKLSDGDPLIQTMKRFHIGSVNSRW